MTTSKPCFKAQNVKKNTFGLSLPITEAMEGLVIEFAPVALIPKVYFEKL
jgi:hypothetical protein